MKNIHKVIIISLVIVSFFLGFFLGYENGLKDKKEFDTKHLKQECITRCMNCLNNPPIF